MQKRRIEPATADYRGQISDIFYKTPIEHVAVIESLRAGIIRGNHYHKETTQHIFVTKGSLRYWYQPVDQSAPVASEVIGPYDLVTTPPYEIHALEILEPNQFIVFSSGVRGGQDYESDTFREFVILTEDMLSHRS
jgi:dTDP-4-dehydrorhamnose 3,5-epimerase-like enzyme